MQPGIWFNFQNQNDHETFFNKSANQFLPYLNKIESETGAEDAINFIKEFQGTLFRFPIRKKLQKSIV